MKKFLSLGNYLFHPLWMPFFGSVLYFYLIPRQFDLVFMESKVLSIVVFSALVPLIFIYFLRVVKPKVFQAHASSIERRLGLLLVGIVLLGVNMFVIKNHLPGLFYYFMGLILSIGIALIVGFTQYKISLHSMGISGLYGFVIGISLFFRLNMIVLIALLTFVVGWVLSARLARKKYAFSELAFGIWVGFLPQALFFISALQHHRM